MTTSVPQRQSRLGSAWFPEQDSYQSGGIPTFGSHYSNELPTQDVTTNQWQTRYGWRIDILAAAAYVLGPLSGLLLFTRYCPRYNTNMEQRFSPYPSCFRDGERLCPFPWWVNLRAAACRPLNPNDSAYQSALLTTPAILCRLFVSLFQSLSWLAGALTFIILAFQLLLA